MKDEFIAWIDRADAVYPNIEFNTIQMDSDGKYTVKMTLGDTLDFNDKNIKIESDKWEIFSHLCRILTKHIKQELKISTDEDFFKCYNKINEDSELHKITKSCYGVVLLLRHWLEHHSESVTDFTFTYKDKQGLSYSVRLPLNGIMLLRELVTMITSHSCGIPTENHFKDLLRSRYLMFYQYLKQEGYYVNQKSKLIEINSKYKLRFGRRSLVTNPDFHVEKEAGKICINNRIHTHYDWEGVDYLITYNREKYIIPDEILYRNSVKTEKLSGWKMLHNHTHGTIIE